MIRFTSLGSGSAGNALLVESGATRVLIDCGFGLREAMVRLEQRGLRAEQLTAILVTHEHGDHINGVFKLAERAQCPVYLTRGSYATLKKTPASECRFIERCEAFAVQALQIQPFSVPHDAREPVQFVLTDGAVRLGVLTDTGHSTAHLVEQLTGCQALVLECNHDHDLLMNGAYPPFLKERVGGAYGHLENGQAAQILAALAPEKLQHIIAAHLSEKNNTPELATAALAAVLHCERSWIGIATQENGFDWREIRQNPV